MSHKSAYIELKKWTSASPWLEGTLRVVVSNLMRQEPGYGAILVSFPVRTD